MLTASSANFSNGGNLLMQVPGLLNNGYDRLNLGSGSLTLGGNSTLNINLSNFNGNSTPTLIVLSGSQPSGNFTTVNYQNVPSANCTPRITYESDGILLIVDPVLTWTGADGTTSWEDPGNWRDENNQPETPSMGDDLLFGTPARPSSTRSTTFRPAA